MGQTIYVPIYAGSYFPVDRPARELSVVLSIHNIDLEWRIAITRVDYHNARGQLVRSYLGEPRELAPLETTTFTVEEMDRIGGNGANFVVAWQARNQVNPPLVEALMVGSGSQGPLALITSGKIIRC